MAKQPHIIIFNPDEMRADALAHLGMNPAAVTPFLDRFVWQEAVSFRNAYCQNPVCVPSRCSFFTGLYPHVHGHRTMSYLLRPGEDSLFKELKEAGYHVWMNDRNDLCAGQYPGWVEEHTSEIFYPGNGKKTPGPVNPGQRGEADGAYYYSHFEGQLQTDAEGKNYNSDDEVVDAAIARVKQWKEGEEPLCMFLGLFYPHPPYMVEEPYFSAIDRGKLSKRISMEECSGKSKMLRMYHEYQNLEDLSEAEWDELRATYYGMCMKIDEQFRRLCEGLKEAGLYDDCAIFFFSDHGDFAGDYGMAEKAQNSFEDCLTRIPFLIKPPKGEPVDAGISDSLVELVDFYATAMEYAGVKPNHSHFGKSLRPILADRTKAFREYVFCEGGRLPGELHCDEYHMPDGKTAQKTDVYWPKKMAQSDDEAHGKATMIRDKRYKYISRILGEDEFYDLKEDPGECKNRITDPALSGEVMRMQRALMKWLQATSDVVPYDHDRRWTEEMLWRKVRHLVPSEYEEDVREKIRKGIGIGPLFGYCHKLSEKKSMER